MSASDAILARLLALHPKKIDLSLDRMNRLLADLGNPQLKLPPTIHVAGTNGKGSTIAFMRAILEAAGLRVHVYTSPHLVRFNERIRLSGALVSDEALGMALDAVEAANGGKPITFFEATTAAAFKLFSENAADVLLLEVGLGGRLDATNVIDKPLCTVVTPISVDHAEFLGASLQQIAGEKCGIFRPSAMAIVSQQNETVRSVIENEVERLRIAAKFLGQEFLSFGEAGKLIYQDEFGLMDLPMPRLVGAHQLVNAGTAMAAIRYVFPELPLAAFERAMTTANWPGRLQNISNGIVAEFGPPGAEIWLDGGHNAAGADVIAAAMTARQAASPHPLIMIYGSLRSKNPETFIKAFAGLASELIAVPIQDDHASWSPAEIAQIAGNLGVRARVAGSVKAALTALAQETLEISPRILIVGSLHLVGEALALNESLPT